MERCHDVSCVTCGASHCVTLAARHWQQHPCCRFLIFLHPSDQSLLTSEHITTDHGYHGHQHRVSPHSGLWRFILNLKCKFYIFGHYVTCHIYLEFCKTDISSFHLKILISISPVNLNIIKPVIEKNNNGTVVEQNDNDIDESHEKMNLVDAFEEDYYDGEDREDRQLFFQRFRPRPLRLNPAAAALIPAIPTFVGGLHLIKTMIQMRKVDPRPGHSLVTTMEFASWCKIKNNSPPKRPEQFLHHPIN